MRYIGHRDLLRAMERLLRRSQLPVSMSEGFHPKVRMSFPSALALGVAGEDEVVELDLTAPADAGEVVQRLNVASYAGLAFHSAIAVHAGRKKTAHVASVFEMTIPGTLAEMTAQKIAALLAESNVSVVKHNGKSVDVRAAVNRMTLDGHCLQMELAATTGADASFREVIEVLGLREYLFRTIFPVRKKVVLSDQIPATN
ncbi:MAG: TIGR03936 family radical SAM-associated protein [Planctomycetaceae bacterium]|nr:TIGR03936 family radical SAM-associated protein [Planctomycetaceae bacterium]